MGVKLFASRYKVVLPSEEELRKELDRERTVLLEQAEEYQADGGSDALIIGPITSIMEPPTGHHPVAWFLCHHKAKPPF